MKERELCRRKDVKRLLDVRRELHVPRQRLVFRQELGRFLRQELLQPSAAPFDIAETALMLEGKIGKAVKLAQDRQEPDEVLLTLARVRPRDLHLFARRTLADRPRPDDRLAAFVTNTVFDTFELISKLLFVAERRFLRSRMPLNA